MSVLKGRDFLICYVHNGIVHYDRLFKADDLIWQLEHNLMGELVAIYPQDLDSDIKTQIQLRAKEIADNQLLLMIKEAERHVQIANEEIRRLKDLI